MLKIRNLLILITVALFVVACGDDNDPTTPETSITGTYEGYTSASFKYSPKPFVTADETLKITSKDNKTADVILNSQKWGETVVLNAKVELNADKVYVITGEGKTKMQPMKPEHGKEGELKEYACKLTAKIPQADFKNMDVQVQLDIMGGTTITFKQGVPPAEQ